ncbi:MAG: type II secretion system protein [Sarcina sp.]
MRKKLKKKEGLTLLELVIVLGLMGIVTAVVFSFVNTTQRKSKELEIRQELQFEGTMITESMMGNVLEMKNISAIDGHTQGSSDNGNKIDWIEFELVGIGQYKNDPQLNRVSKIKYIIDKNTKELKLEAYQLNGTIENGVEKGDWKQAGIVSEYIKEMRIENKVIKDFISAGTGVGNFEEGLKKLLVKEKSVNLKIVLEDDYYNDKIEHTHTIELSLRNAR